MEAREVNFCLPCVKAEHVPHPLRAGGEELGAVKIYASPFVRGALLPIRNVFSLQIPATVLNMPVPLAFPSCRSTAAASASGALSTGPGIAVSRWRYSAFTLLGGTLLPEEIVRRTKEAVPSLRPFYFAVYAVLPEAMAMKRYVCFLTVRDRKAVLFCDL